MLREARNIRRSLDKVPSASLLTASLLYKRLNGSIGNMPPTALAERARDALQQTMYTDLAQPNRAKVHATVLMSRLGAKDARRVSQAMTALARQQLDEAQGRGPKVTFGDRLVSMEQLKDIVTENHAVERLVDQLAKQAR